MQSNTICITSIVLLLIVVTACFFQVDQSSASSDDSIDVSCEHGFIVDLSTGDEFVGGVFHEAISLEFIPDSGYEFVCWNLTGQADFEALSEKITISSVTGSLEISVDVRNYSSSTRLDNVVNYDNTMVPGDTMMMNWSFKSADLYMNGGTWLGMPCTPLVVGDVVYVRAGSYLYALDINNGTVINAVRSEGLAVNYYHYISYGNGVIFDTTGHKAYDLELNYLYDIPINLRFVIYSDGFFYGGLGQGADNGVGLISMFKTSLGKDNDLVDGVKTNLFETTDTFKLFSQWGQYSSFLIEDRWAFFLEADSNNTTPNGYRGITAFNLETEEHVTVDLTDLIGGMLWDDGWLTYENGYLYLTTYVAGLFDGIREGFEDRNDTLVWVKFDFENGVFESPHCKDIETPSKNKFKGIASGFVVTDGHGYINVRSLGTETGETGVNDEGTCMISFDVGEDGEPMPVCSSSSYMTHGGIVVNTGFEDDGIRYIYMIPYNAADQGVYIFTDRLVDGGWILDEKFSYLKGDDARQTFCSQGVRAGPNGQFVYYVDSGYLDCYIPVDRYKITAVIIEGDYADINVGYGANAGVVLSEMHPTAVFNGQSMTIGDMTYTLVGLNEVKGSWETISDIYKSTYSGQTRTTKAITEAYYRYVLLVAEGTDQRTNNASNAGEAGWYYLDGDHYEKMTMWSADSWNQAVGKQVFYSKSAPSDDTVTINPNLTLNYGVMKQIHVPAGSRVSVADSTILDVDLDGSILSLTGLKEAVTKVTVTVNYIDYPIEVEVLPDVITDDEGNKVIHSHKEIPADDGSVLTVTEDSKSNDMFSHIERCETLRDNLGSTLSVKTITIDTNSQDYEALDENGNPSSTACTETMEVDGSGNMVSHTTVSTQHSSYRAEDGTLTVYDIKSDYDNMSGTNVITSVRTVSYMSFSVSDTTVEVYEDDKLRSSESKKSIVSRSDYLEVSADSDIISIVLLGDEPSDFVKLIETIADSNELRIRCFTALSSESVVSMATVGGILTLCSNDSFITLDSDCLKNLDTESGDLDFRLSSGSRLTPKQQNAVGDALVFSVVLLCGETEQHDFGSFSMSISCDIEPQSGKELRVWRINDDATKTYATGVSYADGRVTFTADHLSIYAVGYEAGESQGGDEPEPVAYTLRILANDGSDSSSASAFTDTDASVVLPSSVQWAREGYSAAGFSTSSNGSGTVYALGRSLTISEAVALADQDRTVTLYVVWEQMQCSVTWAYDSGDVTVTVPYGTEIQKPEDAVREPTDTVSYEFAGWAGYKEGMKATADARFIPVFKSTVISYSDDDVEDSVLTVDTGADSVTVASGFVTKMKEASESGTITEVKFELEAGTIAFGSSSISEMSETQTVSMSLVSAEDLGSAVKVVTGGRPVFAIDFGGTETFTEPVKVSVSYALGEDESAEGLEVWYVRDDGTHEVLPCTYTEGRIVFETTHNSYYSVMYPGGDEPAEDDVPSGSSDNGLLVYAGIGVIAVAALVGAAVVLRRRG